MPSLTIQISDQLLERADRPAHEHGVSTEVLAAKAVEKVVVQTLELEALKKQVDGISREQFEKALDSVRALNAPPLPGDEMPDM